jgi:hypothetical protein
MKLILITFGGREVSLRILFTYIEKYKKYISEYRIYVATTKQSDIDFMESFAKLHDFVKIIYTYKDGNKILNDLELIWDNAYTTCQEDDEVYIKLDDDIVYLEENLFTDFVKYRVDNVEIPILYPIIINNTVINSKLQDLDIIQLSQKTHLVKNWPSAFASAYEYIKSHPGEQLRLQDLVPESNILCPVAWGNFQYCYKLHLQFLDDMNNDNLSKYRVENWTLKNCEPASIACISWLGSSLKKYINQYGPVKRDEQWWSVFIPTWTVERNVVHGNTIVSHYAYYRQREQGLDSTPILSMYYDYALAKCSL